MRRRKGVGLGVTLVIVALLAVVGFTLAALTVGRLQLLGNLQHKRHAHRLAMSAIEAALGKLNQQPQYGANGNDPAILVAGDDPQNRGRLTFNPSEARASVNNLAGLTPLGNVPAASARLVAEGRYGGSSEVLEALVTQPVFPFALACHGPIHSTQGLIVATLAEDSPTGRQNLLTDPARYGKPANVLSNGTSLNSVQILGPSTICGDLQTSGRVDLSGTPIQILGELREDQDPGSIPQVELAQLLPSSPQVMASAPSNSPTLHGAVVCNGPFVCTGDLKLEGASLYVKGNLDVGGQLQGNGTLTVEGTTHLRGSTNLSTLGRVALVSQGDVTLDGTGPQQSYFKGLVYTKGKLTAHGLLVYGCLLGAGPGPAAGPQLDLQDCVVVQDNGPLVEAGSAPASGQGDLYMYDPVTTSEANQLFRTTAQMMTPQRLRLTLTPPLQSPGPTLEFEFNPDDAAEREAFRTNVLAQRPHTVRIGLRFNASSTGPSLNPTPTTVPTTDIPLLFTSPQELQSSLAELKSYLGTTSGGVTLFDLNQFLRPNERLRLASCRRIH